jgi:aspartate aminotransferase
MSAMRKLIPLAQAAKARGLRVIHLNLGQPDIETPPEFWEAIRAFPDHEPTLAYAPSAGRPELIASLVTYYERHDIPLKPEQIIVTIAGCEALVFAMTACCDVGDEIILPEPYYSNYSGVAGMAGVKLVPFTTHAEEGYHLPSREAIEQKITPRTRAILYANPGNPTGTVYTREELILLGEIAREHDLFLLGDEVYREFTYDGTRAISVLQLPGLEEYAVSIDSVSKRYSACGARVGCIVSRNTALMQALLKLAAVRLSAPALEQIGAAACYNATPPEYTEQVRVEYTRRRDLVIERLSQVEGITCHKPDGAFYAMARIAGVNTEDFSSWLLNDFEENGETVMVAPGAGFYSTPGLGRDEIRIAYVLELETLGRGMDLLVSAIRRYRQERA